MATLAEQIRVYRRQIVTDALVLSRGNRTQAARELGVTPRQMFRIVAEELTDRDIKVIAAKCAECGGIDPKSAAGAIRA